MCVVLLTMFSAETRVLGMVKGNLRVDKRRRDVCPVNIALRVHAVVLIETVAGVGGWR